MAFTDDLNAEVGKILSETWEVRDGRRVPDAPDIKLSNDAVRLTGAVLYADLAESTDLVARFTPEFVAKVYKSYLTVACRIIRQKGGVITAFDGDRVMAVFIGESPNTDAARVALAINHAVVKVINPALRSRFQLPDDFRVSQAVGIDTSELFVARTGIRNANDLVWVGRAANYAAKLCSLREASYASWITHAVYEKMHESVKTSTSGEPMWEVRTWTARKVQVYRSSWTWPL